MKPKVVINPNDPLMTAPQKQTERKAALYKHTNTHIFRHSE